MVKIQQERTELVFSAKNPPLNPSEAIEESSRCIFCYDAPCIKACPTEINIPQFIKRIQDNNLAGSAATILESNILGLSCASVCPVEVLCVGACVYNQMNQPPIPIGRLQQYAMEHFYQAARLEVPEATEHKVALVGGGPASLACAAYLRLSGVQAVIFEKNEMLGGLNATAVAPYKWKLEENLKETAFIQALGVEIKTNCAVGKDISAESCLNDYAAVFLGVGLGKDSFVLESGDCQGVYGALEVIGEIKLKQTRLLEGVRKAVIIGAGNTALDVVQELAGLGIPEVVLTYRKTRNEMSGYQHELRGALKLGVQFLENLNPKSLLGRESGKVRGVEFSSPEGDIALEADMVIFATGQQKHPVQEWFPQVKTDEKGRVVVDAASRETSMPNVYAGGDCINGGKEVVNAVADGRQAAYHILKKLNCEVNYGRFID